MIEIKTFPQNQTAGVPESDREISFPQKISYIGTISALFSWELLFGVGGVGGLATIARLFL